MLNNCLTCIFISYENINSIFLQHEEGMHIIGIEPSAILTFKDEYLRLADDKEAATSISKHTFLVEEFIQQDPQRPAFLKGGPV